MIYIDVGHNLQVLPSLETNNGKNTSDSGMLLRKCSGTYVAKYVTM